MSDSRVDFDDVELAEILDPNGPRLDRIAEIIEGVNANLERVADALEALFALAERSS